MSKDNTPKPPPCPPAIAVKVMVRGQRFIEVMIEHQAIMWTEVGKRDPSREFWQEAFDSTAKVEARRA